MYHYFPGKHAILLALLLDTVHPSVEYASVLAERGEPDEVRLWALCAYDVGLLLSGDDNTGSLYLLPELGDEKFTDFRAERRRLYDVYRILVAGVLDAEIVEADAAASLVFGLVESVILRRRTEETIDAVDVVPRIADAALRILGVRASRLRTIRSHAERLATDLGA